MKIHPARIPGCFWSQRTARILLFSAVAALILTASGLALAQPAPDLPQEPAQAAVLAAPAVAPELAAGPQVVSYTYDAAGRLIRADYGSETSIVYAYDAAGNLVGAVHGQVQIFYLPLITRR